MGKVALKYYFFSFAFLRFIFTGILNTIVGYGVYAGLMYLGLYFGSALLLSTILGIFFNYFSFAKLAFSSRIDWLSFSKFIFAYTLVYLDNFFLLSMLIEFTELNSYIGQFICLPINVIISYLLMNKWVYKDLKNADY